jgi:hypothetical protein
MDLSMPCTAYENHPRGRNTFQISQVLAYQAFGCESFIYILSHMSASQGHVLELKESVQANELCAGFWNLFTSSE